MPVYSRGHSVAWGCHGDISIVVGSTEVPGDSFPALITEHLGAPLLRRNTNNVGVPTQMRSTTSLGDSDIANSCPHAGSLRKTGNPNYIVRYFRAALGRTSVS